MKKTIIITWIFFQVFSAMGKGQITERMLWSNRGRIQSSNLDGTDIQTIITDGSLAAGLDFDSQQQKVYWTDANNGLVKRANLDGTNIEILYRGSSPYEIVLDPINQKMYWTDRSERTIHRSNYDGTNIELLVPEYAYGLDLDVNNNKMYWSQDNRSIFVSNLDGTDKNLLLNDTSGGITRLALDLGNDKIYWSNDNYIKCSNLDGSNINNLVGGGGNYIGINVYNDMIYFTDNFGGKIARSNLDGSGYELLITLTDTFNPNPLDIEVISIPEPTTISLFAIGGLFLRKRKTP